jgi:hypothetical protein
VLVRHDDEDTRLRSRRVPIPWVACEVRPREPSVVIEYQQAGTADGPNVPLSDVVVSFGADVVAVSLFERRIGGVRPDGAVMVRNLKRVTSFVEVPLPADPESRRIIDGTTGREGDRLALPDGDDLRRYGARGCPLWVP